MPFLASEGCFWPLMASITSEVKINFAYVITQGICNNFIEVIFFVGYMVWRPNRLLQHSTTMSLIKNIFNINFLISQISDPIKLLKSSPKLLFGHCTPINYFL